MLFSAKPQHESAIGIHISPPIWNSLPSLSHPTPLGWYRAPVLTGAPWMGCSSVVQCVRRLMGQALCCSAAADGRKEAMVMAPPPPGDSAVLPCFSGCLAFLHRHFPPWSHLSHPLNPPLCSQQQPSPWDCSTVPKLQLPSVELSRRPESLSGVCLTVARTVWFFLFRLPQISCFTLSLKCFSSDSKVAPLWGLDLCFSSPTHWGQVQSYQHPCFSP